MSIKIALAGNPNTGKTTLFNALTGSDQYVGNWPGVTVEKKEGRLAGQKDVIIQDLPGIYSLSPYSLEEKVSRQYLVEEKPDAILNIVDGTNLERNLYLTTQLAELGLPMMVAVNMMDVVKRNGDTIDFACIGKALHCQVVGIAAQKGDGCNEAATTLVSKIASHGAPEVPHVFGGSVEHALAHIEESIQTLVPKHAIRWYAIKLFERDRDVIKRLGLGVGDLKHIEEHIRDCEKELEDDAESIITSQRYEFIKKLTDKALKKNAKKKETPPLSDRIDRIVTHSVFALPLFVLMLCAMWFLAVADCGPGTLLTDWANDGFLGTESWTLPFTSIEVPGLGALLASGLERIGCGETVRSLVIDGAWGGVATVLGFVPVITIVFLFLSFLEDCGYMARVAFIMDRLFRKFGLSGKSFIPILVGKGCGVPAVMSTRTIENERDHRMTAILATFVPCGAKTVIIAMFASVFFRDQWYVAPLMDVIGIAIIILGGIALKKSSFFAGEAAPFIMELPAYHLPTAKGVVLHTWNRVRGYVLKAGLVIFPVCVALWCVMHFDWHLNLLAEEEIERSILRDLGGAVAWFFAPLGFGTWQGAAASVTAELAKEQATATLQLMAGGEEGIAALFGTFSSFPRVAALSFLVFNLFVPPCIVAVVATFREMGSQKWGWFAVAFQMFVGYTLALSIYQFGCLFAGGGFSAWLVPTVIVDLFVLWAVFRRGAKQGTNDE